MISKEILYVGIKDSSIWNVQNNVFKTTDSHTNNNWDCTENPAVKCL